MDQTHPQETSIQYYMPSPDLEPTGKEEERPASQQLEARHRGRTKATKKQLGRDSQSSPEQSASMAYAHPERRA